MAGYDDWDLTERGLPLVQLLGAKIGLVPTGIALRLEVLLSREPHKAQALQIWLSTSDARTLADQLQAYANEQDRRNPPDRSG